MASTGQVNPIESYGHDSQYRSEYSVEDVNRLFRSFTDYQSQRKTTAQMNGIFR
mgnify:CR=1 FL=1